MSQPSPDRPIRFKATFRTLAEATIFLAHFRNKFGSIRGRDYSVSATGTGNDSATGPIIAFVSFSPWQHGIAARNRVDFESLLSAVNATEISN
jgi:hypothetical protein